MMDFSAQGGWQPTFRPGQQAGFQPACPPSHSASPPRLELLRPPRLAGSQSRYGRRLAGVAAGLGAHLRLNPSLLRVLFVLSAPVAIGPLLYLWLWLFVPSADPWARARYPQLPVDQSRLARSLSVLETQQSASPEALRQSLTILGALFLLGAALAAAWLGPAALWQAAWLPPVFMALMGMVLVWLQLPAFNLRGSRLVVPTVAYTLGGAALIVAGIAWLLGGIENPLATLRGALAALLSLAVLALVLTPLWNRLYQQFRSTQADEARQAERADIAAHLHDSVLQTLALIRARADQAEQVSRLARAQERQLRQWLYVDRPAPGSSLGEEIRNLAGDIEDLHGVAVEVITVGDVPPGSWARPLLGAVGEALNNAARHGAAPISLYLEVHPSQVEVFVRDHGPGFDLEAVSPDRHGVRDSIVARMSRAGGAAVISRRAPGIEIHLSISLQREES